MVSYHIHSFASTAINENIGSIIHILNKGYDVTRYKYNIITTPRIKGNDTLLPDFSITEPEKAYFILCFNEPKSDVDVVVNNDESIDDAGVTKEKLQKLHPNLDLSDVSDIRYDITAGGSEQLPLPQHLDNSFLGMICLKPQGGEFSYEITGFISFYKGIGTKMIDVCETFAKERLHAKTLLITAIHEHNLRGMYEKWGFTWHDKILVPLVAVGEGSEHLEANIGATQDFHLDLMSKQV